MTYYEWIDYFYSLQKAPITEEAINKINNSNIDYKGNIKVRFLNQIVKLINIRLNNALDNFLLKTRTLIQDKNVLSIEINDLKKEIIFARQLASTKHFDEDVTKQLLKSIDGFGEEMNQAIKARYASCNNNEIVMLINNTDLNA